MTDITIKTDVTIVQMWKIVEIPVSNIRNEKKPTKYHGAYFFFLIFSFVKILNVMI